jgi:arylsulfatase A-like enzyme
MRTTITILLACCATALAAPAKPSILHIHADDHRPDGLRALGNKVLQTPNLDTLVERGFVFTRCYTQGSMVGAVCLPSRTMMLTGRSLFRIPGREQKGDPATTLPSVIKSAGYETWHMGKAGNEYTTGLKAFDTNLLDEKGERAGASRRHADATIKFVTERDKSKPFYIYLAPSVPHDPRSAEPQFHRLYDPSKIALPPAFMPVHPFDNGDMIVRDEKLAPWPRTPADTKQQLADYYACVTGLDHHVGRIFEALKKTGQWDNTIIIFTGDNGLSLGEHGLFGKQNLYEFGGMHVPLVIAGPGVPKGRSDALVYLMDLFPTFCDFAGATPPQPIEGRSLAPVIRGKAAKVRDALYTAYRECQRAVRDDRWKLIRYPQVNVTQLFDLRADPRELTNLADKPEHAGKVKEMLALLKKEMAAYDDPVALEVANPKPTAWTAPTGKEIKHHWLCVDNGKNLLIRVDQLRPDKSWAKPIPPGSRDIQLIEDGRRILVSHGNGAAEYRFGTGEPDGWAVTRYSGIQSAVRLLNGHTLLARVDATVYELDADGKEISCVTPKEKLDIRLMRLLDNGNLLLGGATPKAIVELARTGAVVRKIPLSGKGYTAVRLANGHYRSGTGDECKVIEMDADGKIYWFVGGKAEHPSLGLDFFSGWDTLPNGNIVVANWLGHGKQGKGCHLAEFTRDNKLVWTWQDHALARQITNVKMLE